MMTPTVLHQVLGHLLGAPEDRAAIDRSYARAAGAASGCSGEREQGARPPTTPTRRQRGLCRRDEHEARAAAKPWGPRSKKEVDSSLLG